MLDLPGWWVAAGAVVQTIWNHVTGRDPEHVADAFGLVLRPNPRQAPRHVYEAKVARWTEEWPGLTALPWP
ncbi:nucleotidyltransferase family protein [Nonomuraea sp. NPDC003709]|uniref:nucleotidyltransferase family protein n=1 Tax=Nonomuraea sp. NPDC003709 TaxID=3154450 RepID=UPI0033A30C85